MRFRNNLTMCWLVPTRPASSPSTSTAPETSKRRSLPFERGRRRKRLRPASGRGVSRASVRALGCRRSERREPPALRPDVAGGRSGSGSSATNEPRKWRRPRSRKVHIRRARRSATNAWAVSFGRPVSSSTKPASSSSRQPRCSPSTTIPRALPCTPGSLRPSPGRSPCGGGTLVYQSLRARGDPQTLAGPHGSWPAACWSVAQPAR